MAEVVNLNKFRKAKARSEKDARTQHNRIEHGTPKALKDLAKARRTLRDKKLDDKKRGDDDGGTPKS